MMDSRQPKAKILIGRAEAITLPELGSVKIPARVDTGANTSAIWASHIREQDGALQFTLFGEQSSLYSGLVHHTSEFDKVVIATSTGQEQERYKVRLLIKLRGKKIRCRFTLADRSMQTYPVLLGRNVLRGKFVVDVTRGKPLYKEERERSQDLQAKLTQEDQI
jgi:hypothetical protein